jgi:predicted DNA-binding transcriptional regulator AlpA
MPGFLTQKEVLQLVKVSPRTLYSWVCSGKFPQPVRLDGEGKGARKRWPAAEVEKWMQAKLAERREPKEIVA